jgi:hypothetical protein
MKRVIVGSIQMPLYQKCKNCKHILIKDIGYNYPSYYCNKMYKYLGKLNGEGCNNEFYGYK